MSRELRQALMVNNATGVLDVSKVSQTELALLAKYNIADNYPLFTLDNPQNKKAPSTPRPGQ